MYKICIEKVHSVDKRVYRKHAVPKYPKTLRDLVHGNPQGNPIPSLVLAVTEHVPPGIFYQENQRNSHCTVGVTDDTQGFHPFGPTRSDFSYTIKVSGHVL